MISLRRKYMTWCHNLSNGFFNFHFILAELTKIYPHRVTFFASNIPNKLRKFKILKFHVKSKVL